MAKMSKRTDNRFEIKVSVGGGKRLSVYGATEAEARKKAKELRELSTKYDMSNVCRMSVKDYMNHWLYTVKINELKPASFDRVEQSCKYQIYPYIGDLQVQALTADDIQQMLNAVAKTHSRSTVKKAYNNLNSCLNLGVARNEILRNPAIAVTLPSSAAAAKPVKEIRPFTENEIAAIVDECKRTCKNGNIANRYGYAFLLILNTGMRLGEALYLKWKDVDFENKTIYVHGNVTEHKSRTNGEADGYVIAEQETPKTKKSIRYINLNSKAIDALEHLREIIGDDERVIATENHSIVSPHNMHKYFRSILDRCYIKNVDDIIHSLRHTFATTLILKGVDIKVVSELLGHSDVGTTVNILYGHICQSSYISIFYLYNNKILINYFGYIRTNCFSIKLRFICFKNSFNCNCILSNLFQ